MTGASEDLQTSGPTPAESVPEQQDIEQPVLVKPKGLVAVVLLLFVATAGAAVLYPTAVPGGNGASLQLTSWRPPAAAVDAINARRAARVRVDFPSDPAGIALADKIADQMRTYLAAEQELGYHGVRANPQARQQLGSLEEGLRTFALRHGNAAFRALVTKEAAAAGRQSAAAVVEVLGAGGSLGAAQPNAPTLPEVTKLDALMPGVRKPLSRIGLERHVVNGALDPAAQLVVEALVEQRWRVFAARLPPPLPQRDTEVERLLLAFRIEADPGLSTARKLELIDQLAGEDATYPATFVTAVLLAREGRYRAARTLFLRSAEAGQLARRSRANARWCRKRGQTENAPASARSPVAAQPPPR